MRKNSRVSTEEHYVYAAYGVDKELLYVGKGKGARWKHCNSGISSSKALNRYYFSNGEGECITTKILYRFASNSKALKKEKELIDMYQPPFNLDGVGSPKMALMEEVGNYYRNLHCHLQVLDEELGRKKHINWFDKLKYFIKEVGYVRLKEGIPVNRNSLSVYNDPKLLGLYRAIVSHSTAPKNIINIFEIEKTDPETYYIKLNTKLK